MSETTVETPVKKKERTPAEILRELEAKVVEYRISDKEFNEIRAIGPCPAQIQFRISALRFWLKRHQC